MQAFKQHCVEQYDKGQPVISDTEFDLIFGDTNHHESQVVTGNQVTLPVWMGSLNKIRTNHQLYLWSSKYKDASLELTAKLDGVSGLLGPNATFLYQRGNGKVSQDISKIIPHLNLPKVPYLVRGEIIIPVKTFDTYYVSYKNPRNLVAGLLYQKNPKPQDLQRLHFVAYEIIQTDKTIDLDFISRLEQDQFKVPLKIKVQPRSEPFSFDHLYNTLNLTSYLYETDGVVVRAQVTCQRVTSGNPKHMVALKLDNNSDVAVTEVVSVSWNISKWSLLYPVVHLKPVHLRGVTISNVTGNNATFIRDNQIGPGAILKIKRSGGVIPKIVKVLKPSSSEFCGPEPYEWSGVHIKKPMGSMEGDVEVLRARFINTLKGLEIKHLGPKGVHKLVPEVQSFLSLVRLIKDEQFLQVSRKVGISSAIASKVQDQLQSLLFKEGVEPPLLIGVMGTFGPNIGYKRLQSIVEVIPTFLRTETVKLKGLYEVKGLAKLAEVIYEGYSEAYNVVLNLESLGVKFLWPEERQEPPVKAEPAEPPMKAEPAGGKGPLQMNIVYSGFRDLGVDNDIKPGSSVSLKTDLLVVKDLTSQSTKVTQAHKFGVKIMLRDDFVKEFQGHLKLKL